MLVFHGWVLLASCFTGGWLDTPVWPTTLIQPLRHTTRRFYDNKGRRHRLRATSLVVLNCCSLTWLYEHVGSCWWRLESLDVFRVHLTRFHHLVSPSHFPVTSHSTWAHKLPFQLTRLVTRRHCRPPSPPPFRSGHEAGQCLEKRGPCKNCMLQAYAELSVALLAADLFLLFQ